MADIGDKAGNTSQKTALEAARERAEERRKGNQAKAEERELEALNLAEELAPKFGEQGVKFEVVCTDVGVFAVKCPDFTTAKKFNSLDKKTDEDVVAFVDPCVISPARAQYRAVSQEHGGVSWRLANAMLAMYEGSAQHRLGKF